MDTKVEEKEVTTRLRATLGRGGRMPLITGREREPRMTRIARIMEAAFGVPHCPARESFQSSFDFW
jgi:hypothetical protein